MRGPEVPPIDSLHLPRKPTLLRLMIAWRLRVSEGPDTADGLPFHSRATREMRDDHAIAPEYSLPLVPATSATQAHAVSRQHPLFLNRRVTMVEFEHDRDALALEHRLGGPPSRLHLVGRQRVVANIDREVHGSLAWIVGGLCRPVDCLENPQLNLGLLTGSMRDFWPSTWTRCTAAQHRDDYYTYSCTNSPSHVLTSLVPTRTPPRSWPESRISTSCAYTPERALRATPT